MKNKIIICFACTLLCLATSCSEESKYIPGEPVSSDCQSVCFSFSNESEYQFLLEDDIEIMVMDLVVRREKYDKAAVVPIVASGDTEYFNFPSFVEFGAGEQEAIFTVNVAKKEEGVFTVHFGITGDEYLNPYLMSDSGSPLASVIVDIYVPQDVLWSVTGTYSSAELGEEWEATLVSYSNGNYVLEGWYGVEGYDLEFYLDDNSEVVVTNYYYSTGDGYFAVQTGRDDNSYMYVYYVYGGGYSAFSGDSTSGDIRLYTYYSSGGYDYFSW